MDITVHPLYKRPTRRFMEVVKDDAELASGTEEDTE